MPFFTHPTSSWLLETLVKCLQDCPPYFSYWVRWSGCSGGCYLQKKVRAFSSVVPPTWELVGCLEKWEDSIMQVQQFRVSRSQTFLTLEVFIGTCGYACVWRLLVPLVPRKPPRFPYVLMCWPLLVKRLVVPMFAVGWFSSYVLLFVWLSIVLISRW